MKKRLIAIVFVLIAAFGVLCYGQQIPSAENAGSICGYAYLSAGRNAAAGDREHFVADFF